MINEAEMRFVATSLHRHPSNKGQEQIFPLELPKGMNLPSTFILVLLQLIWDF
jgi:hypothetical protein